MPLALSLTLLAAAVTVSAEPIREKEEDSYIGKNSVTQKEAEDYVWIVEPEQEGDQKTLPLITIEARKS